VWGRYGSDLMVLLIIFLLRATFCFQFPLAAISCFYPSLRKRLASCCFPVEGAPSFGSTRRHLLGEVTPKPVANG